jgi:hypothetical protein
MYTNIKRILVMTSHDPVNCALGAAASLEIHCNQALENADKAFATCKSTHNTSEIGT